MTIFQLSYRQERQTISTAAPCLWDQGTSIFKLTSVPLTYLLEAETQDSGRPNRITLSLTFAP